MDEKHVFSIDGMSNVIDNKIGIDGQIIIDQNKNQGIYGSLSFSPLGIFSGWIDYIQFDQDLDINTLGYLWRENYSQTKLGFKLQSLQPWSVIRNAALILEGDMEENSQGIDLGKTIELGYAIQFSNFWDINGGIYKINEHYDDRKIIYDYSRNIFGPLIFIPEVRGSHINISSDNRGFTKKELLKMSVQRDKLQKSLGGIAKMKKVPDLVFVIDTNYESLAIKESIKLGIPIVAILDTNSNPEGISFPIPGNDDARRSIDLYCSLIKETIENAKKITPNKVEEKTFSGLDTTKTTVNKEVKKNN